MTAPRPLFRADINGLRALSVAMVVAYHLGLKGAGGGFAGVDVFFVISGFLMTQIIREGLERGTFEYWRFVRARAWRIFPALFTLSLALLAIGSLVLPPSDLEEMATQALNATLFWSNHYSYARFGYNVDTAEGNWFLHAWSLAVEWQFYLVYPLLLSGVVWALRRFPSSLPATRRVLGIVLAVLGAVSLGYYLFQSHADPRAAFFFLPARAWEFVAGGLAARLSRDDSGGRIRFRAPLSYAGLGLITLSTLWFGLKHLDPVGLGIPALLPVLGATLVLAAGHTENPLLRGRVAQALGSWSYSIYLWHWPLIVGAALTDVWQTHRVLTRLAVLAASVLLGALSYRFVESLRNSRRSPTTGGALWVNEGLPFWLLGCSAAAATVVVLTHGESFRLPREMLTPRVASRESDYFPDSCSNFGRVASDLRTCTISKGEGRRVLVIGDSHGEHLYPWFNAKSEVSVNFFTEAECPPIPNFERLGGLHCLDYATEAWRRAALPRYDTVVVSARWVLAGGNGPSYCHVEADGTCRVVKDSAEKQGLIREELRAGFRSLLASGKAVVVLDGTPEASFNVPRRLERERFLFGAIRSSIAFSSVNADYEWIDVLFAEMSRAPGFHLVSLRPSLCAAGKCSVWDSLLMRSIYTDGSHFAPDWIIQHCDFFTPFTRSTPPA